MANYLESLNSQKRFLSIWLEGGAIYKRDILIYACTLMVSKNLDYSWEDELIFVFYI